MKSADAKVLCERLMYVDAEAEVIALLNEAGYWDDPTCWRFYGDQEET